MLGKKLLKNYLSMVSTFGVESGTIPVQVFTKIISNQNYAFSWTKFNWTNGAHRYFRENCFGTPHGMIGFF